MANQFMVELLKQGYAVWNTWKLEHPTVRTELTRVDLSLADLSGVHLKGADLSGTYLSLADLSGADLSLANFSDANLTRADLSDTNLSGANLSLTNLSDANLSFTDLSRANLRGANLSRANLSNANLSLANLSLANLTRADLSGANLSGANIDRICLSYTIIAQVDLCDVKGLDTVIYSGPSTININSVRLPEEETRMLFLRGVGFSDTFIDYYHALFTTAIQYASCFISYAHQDEVLAQRLYKDLQNKGVRCWFAPHDLRPGTLFHRGIENAIQIHETVILLLSEHAVASNWVAYEVETTLNRQARERRDLLFPLRLDEAVMRAKDEWATRLRESRHIGDFTNWHDDAIYQQRFADLLRHLKVKAT